ncbi:contact-dependent growth inhibition system immunity protein [Xanthomonas campestris pv. phormiicola]|uniref:contact-dependent growth inhibition system immunity protein n=1 Tax=Xanthomonas bonasiae TaxID=2810351 RepID=UPI00197D0386|nr:contact-dependent growth inhibition system immunity protein [Xanthomonas bonasiae]MBN6114403.1 CdiI family contact-dependent growth inhibition immunity protein [Xanthomonas bonasiae]MCC4598356.1 CdiI family contact-dependent growth inhibition immunity protein [Xanthomonas campestris pv. phormiicola]UYC16594.1 contact-dependent growth inhibition system immunity protein [Xanthomonas campestris pv. phormiicola]
MGDVVKTAWADAKINNDFISVKTFSGYRSSRADPQGVEYFLNTDVADEELGFAVLDALAHSRFVLSEPREDVWIHPEVTFDRELYNYDLTNQRYDQWVGGILEQYGYKTKRALFKDMKNCSIESKCGQITIRPSHHEKLEAWSGKGIGEGDHVIIPSGSSPSDVGAALRLAFSRCT